MQLAATRIDVGPKARSSRRWTYVGIAGLLLASVLGCLGCGGPRQDSTPTAAVAAAPPALATSTPERDATLDARTPPTLASTPTVPPTVVATDAPTARPTAPPPTATLAAPAVIPTPAPSPAGGALYDVVQVVDGDTLRVRTPSGQLETIRLIGINTPEVVDPRSPVQCFGREASDRAKQLLSGQRVRIEQDPTQDTRDRYGRLLAYVWLEDGTFFNKQMIADGYAQEYTFAAPYRYQADFKAAQQQARAAGLGLWAPDTCNGDTTRPAAPAATAPPARAATATPPTVSTPAAPQAGPVQIVSATGAPPGGRASVTAKAPPGAACSIKYTTPTGTSSTAQGLTPKTADSSGMVSWTWVIGTGTRGGTGTVAVTCSGATASTSLTIG